MLDAFRYQPDEFDSINKLQASMGTAAIRWAAIGMRTLIYGSFLKEFMRYQYK